MQASRARSASPALFALFKIIAGLWPSSDQAVLFFVRTQSMRQLLSFFAATSFVVLPVNAHSQKVAYEEGWDAGYSYGYDKARAFTNCIHYVNGTITKQEFVESIVSIKYQDAESDRNNWTVIMDRWDEHQDGEDYSEFYKTCAQAVKDEGEWELLPRPGAI